MWICIFVGSFLTYYAWVEVFYPVTTEDFYDVLRGFQFMFFTLGVSVFLPPYREILFGKESPPVQSTDNSYMRAAEVTRKMTRKQPLFQPTSPSAPVTEYFPSPVSTNSIYPVVPVVPQTYFPPPQYPLMVF